MVAVYTPIYAYLAAFSWAFSMASGWEIEKFLSTALLAATSATAYQGTAHACITLQ